MRILPGVETDADQTKHQHARRELQRASPQARPLSAGSGHVGLTVENVDEALREVAALGAVAIGDVTVFPEGRSAYCREPGGSFLELLEFKQDGG